MNIREHADYQKYSFDADGNVINICERLNAKLRAIGSFAPYVLDKDVLDIGCDFGFWSFLASEQGAKSVVGLDRNRHVKHIGPVDLITLNMDVVYKFEKHKKCAFINFEAGRQYFDVGKFDTVLLFSLYHHVYQACGGDHEPIWYWLRKLINQSGTLLWENPVDLTDQVANLHVHVNRESYNEEKILRAAQRWFSPEYVGHSGHERHRYFYTFRPDPIKTTSYNAVAVHGAGGAARAWAYEHGRRRDEVYKILGMVAFPGSLNLKLEKDFDWDCGYYRSQVLDVIDRKSGLTSEWALRWARFYPVTVNGKNGFAFRFEGEKYKHNFVEIISEVRLRDTLTDDKVLLTKDG